MTREPRSDRNRRPIRSARPAFEPLEGRALLASLMVTNALDSGAGSLRQAITDADAATGASTIGFAIPGPGVQMIALASDLPTITEPVTIDGTTQPGYSGSPLIALDGAAGRIPIGLDFESGSTNGGVKGLAIDRFTSSEVNGQGIFINADSVTIQDDLIGVDPAGNPSAGNDKGIEVGSGSIKEVISGNVIGENNNDGIDLQSASSASISGNFIGTDSAGRTDLGNGGYGIVAEAGSGPSTASNNTIANNGSGAIQDQSAGGLTLSGNALSNNGGGYNLAVVASDASITAAVGQTFTTSYTITNKASAAADVSLLLEARNQFLLGPMHTVESGVINFETNTGYMFPLTTRSLDFGTLQPGQSATLPVAVRVVGAGPEFIDASFSAPFPFVPGQANPGTVATTAISGIGQADISVAALPAPQARAGVPTTFYFSVSGLSNALDDGPSRLFDPLFALSFATTGGASSTGVTTSLGTVMALPAYPNGYGGDFGRFAQGDVGIIAATIIPPSSGRITVTVFAYSPYEADPNPANNLAFAAVQTSSAPPVTPTPVFIGANAVTSSATGPITSVQVDFQGSLNASTAQDVRNYSVTTTGSSARIQIRSATYTRPNSLGISVVTLRFARTQPRTGAPLQLVVNGPGSPGITGLGSSARLATSTLTVPR